LSGLVQTLGTTSLSTSVGTATIIDDDTAGISVTPTVGLTTTEAGGTATYTLLLTSQPTGDVSIALNAGTQLSAATSPVVFTAAN
jgi:hypothetical protein